MAIEHNLLERARIGFHERWAAQTQRPARSNHSCIRGSPIDRRHRSRRRRVQRRSSTLLRVALYNINIDELVGERGRLLIQARRRLRLGWVLAAAAAFERVSDILIYGGTLNLVGSICWLLFLLFVISSQLRSILKQREVTGETISMAISIYLLLGFTWIFLYAVIFQLHPDSFGGLAVAKSRHPVEIRHLFPVLGYFSLTTLSTIGFGDITPRLYKPAMRRSPKASPGSSIWPSWSRDWWDYK